MGTRPLAEWLVKRAALRLPEGGSEECCREWLAEIPAILGDPDVRFGWRRAFRALWFAADQWRGLGRFPATAHEQDHPEPAKDEVNRIVVPLKTIVVGPVEATDCQLVITWTV